MYKRMKLCPFCGGEHEIEFLIHVWRIGCPTCQYHNTFPEQENAREWWNTRTEITMYTDFQQEVVAVLRAVKGLPSHKLKFSGKEGKNEQAEITFEGLVKELNWTLTVVVDNHVPYLVSGLNSVVFNELNMWREMFSKVESSVLQHRLRTGPSNVCQ